MVDILFVNLTFGLCCDHLRKLEEKMRTEKGNPEEDEYEDEEFGSKKEGPSSNAPATAVNNNNNNKNKGIIRSKLKKIPLFVLIM